ncbi:MAG: putative chromosome partitioning protein [Caulobacter sp.]|nr:putative chromosome partitioning protein [Caulobacter sp.]
MSQAGVIVIGNEKGGAGKSTIAVHLATALLHAGATVALMDLDLRQSSTEHFFDHRKAWTEAKKVTLPAPLLVKLGEGNHLAKAPEAEQVARFQEAFQEMSPRADYILIDTPGGDTAISRLAHTLADQIITPMNDSFVDFDMLGLVDPVTLELTRPSLYSETVWNARKERAVKTGKQIDWIVLRNRLASTDPRNRRRLDERVQALAKRVGFRMGPGLRDRVIYRELFPFGLTVADLSPSVRPVAVSLSHVAARQELRAMMQSLGLSHGAGETLVAAE